MFDEDLRSPGGVLIARSVRDLARRARQAMDHPADDAEARQLFEAIEGLERQIEPGTLEDISRWLASLKRHLEDQMVTAA